MPDLHRTHGKNGTPELLSLDPVPRYESTDEDKWARALKNRAYDESETLALARYYERLAVETCPHLVDEAKRNVKRAEKRLRATLAAMRDLGID